MNFRRSVLFTSLLSALALALAPGVVIADDEEEAVHAFEIYDVPHARSAPVVEGPDLYLPSDEGNNAWWLFTDGGDRPVKFGEDTEGYRVPLVDVGNVTSSMIDFIGGEYLDLDMSGSGKLLLRGRPQELRVAKKAFAWLQQGLAPSVRATATLTRTGRDAALLATGSAFLQPGAWTGIYRQRRETPVAVDWDIEIAQESTASGPVVADMPEGEELYLRYHPGQTVSVIELWSGTLRHLDVLGVELSGIRNVPEASGLGRLELPQTSAYRAYTAFAVPAGERSTRTFIWDGPAGPVSLVLDLLPPVAGPGPFSHGEALFETYRTGALDAALDFGRREEYAIDHLSRVMEAYDGDGERSRLTAGFVWYQGEAEGARRIRETLREAEARIATHRVGLRVLAVAEESLRQALASDSLGCGRAVTADVLTALAEDGGSANGQSVVVHALDGFDASFRSGKSVTGITEIEMEVAQQAGGNAPAVEARFDGLAGEISATRRENGYWVDLHARLDHASAEEGRVELVHRAPVGMGSGRDAYPLRDAAAEKTSLPLLGGGSAVVACSVLVPEAGPEVLADIVVRGGEAYLVLVKVVP